VLPEGRTGGHNGWFDFLGFEFRWEACRKGFAIVKRRTSRKKLRGAVERFTEWIREQRDQQLGELMKTVARKQQGHGNYYGLVGNSKSLSDYRTLTLRELFKWLNRRSQRRSYTWRRFTKLLRRFAVPLPRIVERATNPWTAEQAWVGTPTGGESVSVWGPLSGLPCVSEWG